MACDGRRPSATKEASSVRQAPAAGCPTAHRGVARTSKARAAKTARMTALLTGWVNDELQLDPPLTEETLADELSSGFVLGALLHRHNQLADHERLRRRDTADAKIENFCLLEPTLGALGVRFDANAAHGVMTAKPGAAAMVLYQLKVQLEKLVDTAPPVSLRQRSDGVRSLPNMPKKLKKVQYDAARAQLFEAQIRCRAENPNITMERRVLARFEEVAEKDAAKRIKEQERSFALLDQHREVSRSKRLYERQQEAAFLASWEARGLENWAANRRERKHNVKRDVIFEDTAARKVEARVDRQLDRAATNAMSEIDKFERRLVEQKTLEASVAPKALQDVVDRRDPLAESARATCAVVDIGVGVGSDTMSRDVVLDARALRAERDAQDKERRTSLEERRKNEKKRSARRSRFVAEREVQQVEEYHAHRARQLQAQLTAECAAEVESAGALALVTKHKARMAESRAFREAQYKTRQMLDTEDVLRRDQERLEQDAVFYEDDLGAAANAATACADAEAASAARSALELCRFLVTRICRGAAELASLRDEERASLPEAQGQRFAASHSLLENDGDPCDPFTLRDHSRVVGRLDGALLGFEHVEDDGRDCLDRAFADESTQHLASRDTADPPSKPPRWGLDAQLEERESPADVAQQLDAWDAQDYVANEGPFHFSAKVAEAEVRGLGNAEDMKGASKRWSAAADEPEEEDGGYGALRRRQQSLVDAAAAALQRKNDALALIGETRTAEHSLGEAILDCRFAAQHEEEAPVEETYPPEFPLRICLAGRTFAGKSEQAARLADRFRLKVLNVGDLLDRAVALSDEVTLGKVPAPPADSALADLVLCGRRAKGDLKEGRAAGDELYASLVAAAAKEIAAENVSLDEVYNGWILEDFPETRSQAAALEKALTGYDAAKHVHSRWNHPSSLASIAPAPVPKYSGLPPTAQPDTIPSGIDLIFHLPVETDSAYRRCLGRRVDEQAANDETVGTVDEFEGAAVVDARAAAGEYHLDSNRPDYGSDAKARLSKVEDPCNATACLPFQLEAHDAAWPALKEFLERFGTLQDVDTAHLSPEGAFGAVVPLVDAMLTVRSAAAQKVKAERDAKLDAYAAIIDPLQRDLDGWAAQAACARALVQDYVEDAAAEGEEPVERPVLSFDKDRDQDHVTEAVQGLAGKAMLEASASSAESITQELAQALEELVEKGPYYEAPVEEVEETVDSLAFTPLSKGVGEILAGTWDLAEEQFYDGCKKAFRALRELRSQGRRGHFVLRRDFVQYLARTDDRQDLLTAFTEDFNTSIPMDMRVQDECKAELHLRAEELNTKLWEATEEREKEAKGLWAQIRLDGSLQARQVSVSKAYACLTQCEVDRTHASLCLLKDFYAASYPVGDYDEAAEELTERQKASDGCGALSKRTAELVDDTVEASEDALPPNVLEELFGDPFAAQAEPEEAPEAEETPALTEEDMENDLDPAPDCLVAALACARTWALSFAAPDSISADKGAAPGLREAVWQQAELLLARCARLEDACARDRSAVAKRRDQILEMLKTWITKRIQSELSVNEGVVELIRKHIEEERPIEDSWEMLGIVLCIDKEKKIIPLQDTLYWRTHPQAAQLVQHPEYGANLPEPPPLPVPPDLPPDRFSSAQQKDLRAKLEESWAVLSGQAIPPPPGYGFDGLPLLPPGPVLKLWIDACDGASHVRVTVLRDGEAPHEDDRYYYAPYDIPCASKPMLATYKVQTAAADLISVRLELLGEKPAPSPAEDGEAPAEGAAPVLSTIVQHLAVAGGAATLPFENVAEPVIAEPEPEPAPAKSPKKPTKKGKKEPEPEPEPEPEQVAEEPEPPVPKEVTLRWAFDAPEAEPPAPAPAPADANVQALEDYLRAVFERVDADQTGEITIAEAVRALNEDEEFADILGADSSDNVLEAMRALDTDGDGTLSWAEFRAATLGTPEADPGVRKWVTRDALVHVLANAALHTDKLPGNWRQKTRFFFEDAFLAPQGPLDPDQTGVVDVDEVMALVAAWAPLPAVREMPLNDYVPWTDPIAANPAAHPQIGAAGAILNGTDVTYAEREASEAGDDAEPEG